MSTLDPGFWLNRRVMVTGHTGFKGCYLVQWLADMGADVIGFGQEPVMSRTLFEALALDRHVESIIGDIRDLPSLEAVVSSREPEIIVHLAAEALVLDCLKRPVEAFETNLMGTVKLLQAARRSPDLRAIVVVTTDKCYAPTLKACEEDDRLGGDEPYSASKAAAELAVQAFRHSYLQTIDGIGLATARAGNVIGAGDFSSNRLIPDLVRGARNQQSVPIRHPEAIRPWQHVLDALYGYLLLAERLCHSPERYGKAWNFGPKTSGEWPVGRVADAVNKALGGRWHPIPKPASVENPVLRLNSGLARKELGWRPQLSTEEAITWTVLGYRSLLADRDGRWLTRQIESFEERLSRLPKDKARRPLHAESGHDQA